jgi:hypothetical protein
MATNRPPVPQPQTQAQVQQGPRTRILRIGVLLGGKIVEERLIRKRETVLIGQSMKNTFSIPFEGLPLEFPIFTLDNDKYYLRFLPKMDGRLSDGGNVNTLDALKAHGAQNHGDYWQVPLGETSRGKLSLGELTILFQFVTEPPRQPKPMLPASVRGTFADRLDPRLSVILGTSVVIHFAFVIVALAMDVPKPDTMLDRAYDVTFNADTYIEDTTKPKPADTPGADQGPAPKKDPDKSKQIPSTKPKDNPNPGRDAAKDAKMQEDAAAMADLLTGEGPDGKSEGDISRRRPGADLGTQIANVGNKTVAVGGGAGRGSRDNGDARTGTGHGPSLNGGGIENAGGGKVAERSPTGRITVSDKHADDDTSLTPDTVLQKIQSAYMAGLKRCYKNYLVKDASARGKVTLELTINPTGRTVKGAAHGFAGEVDECISAQMSSWRFPIPKDKGGEAVEANFAITLQLVPD